MIYLILLFNIVNVVLNLGIINFLYKMYINSIEDSKITDNEIKRKDQEEVSQMQVENNEIVDEIVYDNLTEDEIENERVVESLDDEKTTNNIEIPTEGNNIDNEEIKEELESIGEPTVTITNDIFTHTSLHKDNIIEIPETNEISRRRRIALKLIGMNKEE